MSEEHDSWFKDAFGVDLGQAVQKIKDEGSAVVNQAVGTVTQVVRGVEGAVEGAIDGVTGAATGAVKKVAGAVGIGGGNGASSAGAGTGSFPLGGSVGRGGKNAPSDVRAVQAALGIGVDGQCGGQTIAAIEAFQRNTMGVAKPDGRVDAGGATERALAGGGNAAASANTAPGGASNDDLLGKTLAGAQAFAGAVAGGLGALPGALPAKAVELGEDLGNGLAGALSGVSGAAGGVVSGLLDGNPGALDPGVLRADLGGGQSKVPSITLTADRKVDDVAAGDQLRISYRVDDLGDMRAFSPTLIVENSSPDLPTLELVESSGTGVIDAQDNTGFFIVEARFPGVAKARMAANTDAKTQLDSNVLTVTVSEPLGNSGRSFVITPTFGIDGGVAAGGAVLTFRLVENWKGGRTGTLQFTGVGASAGLKVNLSIISTSSNFETKEPMTLESFAGSGTISSAGVGVAGVSSLLFQNGVKVSGLGFGLNLGAGAALYKGVWSLTSHTGEAKQDPTQFA